MIIIITPHRRRDLNDGINAIGQTKLLHENIELVTRAADAAPGPRNAAGARATQKRYCYCHTKEGI